MEVLSLLYSVPSIGEDREFLRRGELGSFFLLEIFESRMIPKILGCRGPRGPAITWSVCEFLFW